MAKGISVPVTQSGLEASIQQGVKNVGKVNIPVNVDPSAFKNLAQPLGRVSGLATEFEKSIAASNARVLAFGASVGIINGVQNAFADLVRTGIDVQKTLADIAAISGKGGTELSKFGDALFDVAKNTSQSFKTASQAALEFSRQGLSTEETLKRTNDALTLTRFTTLNAAEAVDVLTAAANSFADTGITTAQIINKLVAVDTKFAVSAEDLANGLARAGSIAQEVGVNFDELNAAVTIAQERTARGGAVIGNALKTIFTRLRSDETVQALRNIGVESLNAQGGLKGAIPILQEVAAKIQGLGGGERVQILEAVASKYNINILSALLDDLNNANSKFGEAVAVSAGANNQAYERQVELNKTLAAQINGVTVSVTQLFNKLAEIGVTENLNSLLKFVNDLLSGFNKLLDSEGTGGNIAKGIIKGLSDVFFTVGLPIIGAIFVKLTKDVAQFGVESLKTILGINQQVRERQALEQAVVNTLIRDQEVMATILALSGNRAKQEEYLLNVYNRQLAALQQVQNIAASVTPALMAGGLSATSGQIKKKAAGGYLPAQEAADIRRGVGGANSSARVVSIPNFAFGGGKRGTMVANTSEYIVPNFANGGSAIFNKDMVKAYGLPAGARKISAAGGYIPNFADVEFTGKYAGIVPSKVAGDPIKTGRAKNGKLYSFPMIYAGSSSQSKGNIDEIRNEVVKVSQNLAVRAATDYATAFDPDLVTNSQAVAQKATQANQNKGAIESFVGSIFEASVASLLDDQHFKESQERSTISTFDFVNNSRLQKIFGIPNGVQFLEAKNNAFEGNLNKIAEKISKVESGGAAFSQKRPTLQNSNKPARYFYEGGQGYLEQEPGVFRQADLSQYKLGPNQGKAGLPRGATIIRGAMGYIPNFAVGNPLGDAVKREMAAGLNPSQIRVTQDGRLRNSQNPNGLAVINTRDEPNGKIPNFADPKYVETKTKSGQSRYYSVDEEGKKTRVSLKEFEEATKKTAMGLDKMFYAMSAVTVASSALESSLKNSNSAFADIVIGAGKAASALTQGALLGKTVQELSSSYKGSKSPLIAGIAGFAGKAALPIAIATSIGGAIIDSVESVQLRNIQDEKSTERGKASVKNVLESGNIDEISKARKKILQELEGKKYDTGFFGFFADKENNAPINELSAALDEINKKIAEGAKQKIKDLDLERKAVKEGRDRVALASVINDVNEKFATAQNQRDIQRGKNQADLIKNSINLTESQKPEIELQQKLLDIEGKKIDSNEASRNKVLQQIASASKLATVDKAALESLMERVRSGEELGGIYEELAKLGTQGAVNATERVQAIISEEKIQQRNLQTEKQRVELITRATIELNNQLKVRELINKTLDRDLERNNRISNIADDMGRQLEIFKLQTPVQNIERSIAGRGFGTRQQTFNLMQAKRNLEIGKEEIEIAYERKKMEKEAQDTVKKQLTESLSNLTGISDLEKDAYRLTISYGSVEQALIALNDAATKAGQGGGLTNDPRIVSAKQASRAVIDAQNEYKLLIQRAKTLEDMRKKGIDRGYSREYLLQEMAVSSPVKAGVISAFDEIEKESDNFSKNFAFNTTNAFRDGMRDALSAAISQTDDLGSALQNVAMNFLKTMQNAFLQEASNSAMLGLKSAFPSVFKFAKGGLVSGGSGYRDDVPAMLTGGEFVMRKSAVQKYGAENLRKMNDGGIFLPGVRGGGAISGYDALRAFANQTTTSGSTDILRGGGSSAFINLEDQSARLSRYALLGDDTINQEIRSAQEQGLNIIQQREAYRTQQRKAFQQQLVGTIASAALSYGMGKLGSMSKTISGSGIKSGGVGLASYGATNNTIGTAASGPMAFGSFTNSMFKVPYKAYGGMIHRYASGGPVDDVPALLMSGEYVMNRQSSSKYGRRLLDSMNQGRLPRFADGGEVGGSTTTTTESNAKMMGDVSININVSGQTSQTEAQGNTNQGGIDYKKMSERIKAVVIETINEEKRLGGSLRSR